MNASFDLQRVVTGLTLGAVGFLLAIVGLWTLSEPKGITPRLAAVQDQLGAFTKAQAMRGDTVRFSPKSLCDDKGSGSIEAWRSRLQADAGKAGITLSSVRLTPPQSTEAGSLVPVDVKISAEGQEGALRSFLHSRAGQNPTVFTDALDLSADGQITYLNLKGRLLCASRTPF